MDDLIRRQSAINAIENTDVPMSAKEWDELTDAIVSVPAVDAVPMDFHDRCMQIEIQKRMEVERSRPEVVRCRECDNWENDWEPIALDPKTRNICASCATPSRLATGSVHGVSATNAPNAVNGTSYPMSAGAKKKHG